jgi:hypothetical protein
MKECPFCHFENFNNMNRCAKCDYPIDNTLQENFNIAEFLKKNYQLYAIFGILIALFEYIMKEVPVEQKYVGIFPLIVAFYLILHLTNKAASIIKSRVWQNDEELLRRESSFQFFIFCLIHALLVITLLMSLPEVVRNFTGFALGSFIFIIFFSANFSDEQNRKTLYILVVSGLFYEIFLSLFLIIPFLAKITNNEFFVTSYTWLILIFLYLATGGIIAYFLVTVGYNLFSDINIPLLLIFRQEREKEDYTLELLTGLVILFGIFLSTILLSIKDLYSGL